MVCQSGSGMPVCCGMLSLMSALSERVYTVIGITGFNRFGTQGCKKLNQTRLLCLNRPPHILLLLSLAINIIHAINSQRFLISSYIVYSEAVKICLAFFSDQITIRYYFTTCIYIFTMWHQDLTYIQSCSLPVKLTLHLNRCILFSSVCCLSKQQW